MKSKKVISLCKPEFSSKALEYLKEALDSGWVTQGPKTKLFEEKLGDYLNNKNCIAVSNCTTALFLSLFVNNIGRGDEVIVPSFTFIATANAVKHTGAKPVFCDIDINTYNIDPEKIEKLITSKTKAIIPVHQMGLPADMDKINVVAKKHNLFVIEDAACAIGSEYNGKKIGDSKNICCFSFHPRKIITTGEGGLITVPNLKLKKKLESLRSHGEAIDDIKRHKSQKPVFMKYSNYGYNFRLSDIQSAVGLSQLESVEHYIQKRIKNAGLYKKYFSAVSRILLPYTPDKVRANYQSYCVRLAGAAKKFR
nr:DegT/DnrJ/EryC1/StrS family aminotransferase [bacterium]